MRPTPETCSEVLSSLPLYVGRDMELEEMSQVRTHLSECSTCREAERRAHQARVALGDSLLRTAQREAPSVWEGVRAGLVAEGILSGGELRPAAPPAPRTLAPRTAPRRLRVAGLAAAAALVFSFGLAYVFEGGVASRTTAPDGLSPLSETHSAGFGGDALASEDGHPDALRSRANGGLRRVGHAGPALHERALEVVPEQGWTLPGRGSSSLVGSRLLRKPVAGNADSVNPDHKRD